MGVNGLWTVVQPCARPTNLATLNRKRLAVDASIWIYQFLKAVRDKEGNALRNSHVVGFFRRICKLLWFGIQPVFVFDGGAPALKRATLQGRRRRREGRRDDAVRTAGKLLAVQMQRAAEVEGEERRRKKKDEEEGRVQQEEEPIPDMENIVYADEVGMSNQERKQNRTFRKTDAYHLPDLQNSIDGMGRPDDPRIMSVEELEEYARQFHEGEDVNLYDFSKIDFDGEFFRSLPPADRYNILNAARIRSRLRMGLSKDQLEDMFPDRMAFSRFQIERVKERNHLTQRLMFEMGMTGTDLTVGGGGRIAGEKNREYILVKNEGVEGGWALGVVSKEKDVGEEHKPIDVDALDFQYQAKDTVDEEWEDEDEFEDVPIEGLNRLPKGGDAVGSAAQPVDAEVDGGEESLFVNDDMVDLFGGDEAIAADEDEDLNRAIAMSLQNQHKAASAHNDSGEDEDFEDDELPAPQWKQKSAEAPKPIATSVRSSGRMVAHIVNNRANAAVRRRESSASSDSDMDLQAALAKAAKKKAAAKKPQEKAPIKPNVKNPFEGPLPFEKLDWKSSIFAGALRQNPVGDAKKATTSAETGELEPEDDEMEGGFEKEPEDKDKNAPRPLPPWMADDTDIRESYRKQKEADAEMAAQDEALAREERLQAQRQREKERIEILSSDDDDSDVEIIDAPPAQEKAETRLSPSRRDASKAVSAIIVEKSPENGDDVVNLVEVDGRTTTSRPAERQDAASVAGHRRSPSPEAEFEDVEMAPQSDATQLEKDKAEKERTDAVDSAFEAMMRSESPPAREDQDGADGTDSLTFEEIMRPDAQPGRINGLATADPVQNDIDPNAPGADEFDDFSDPEEEELLAQMAEEAEEHARFASELNHKSQEENREQYERELRALRAQQKKDRRDADEVTQVMVTECQALLRLFGIPYITAPMEAEAQCAELVTLGLVDGIVTDDSDTFLFGGTRVYKNMFNGNKLVECYLSGDIEKELSLARHELISLALLLGSDYTEGLPGVGPVTAVEILSEFPGPNGLSEFKEWWQDVQLNNRPKSADADSPFRRKFRKSQGTKLFLPPGFPNPAVAEAYLKPEVDRSAEPFQWGVPNLEGLRQFLMATIGWSQERTDEVLVPVIRDMNKRGVEGTQSNITRYFEGSVGVGAKEAFAPRQRVKGSKRMADAVTKLRAKNAGGVLGSFDMTMPVVAPPEPKKKAGKKRKGRQPVTVVGDDDDDNVNEGDDALDDEPQSSSSRSRAKGKRAKA
jgi:DNA excision repair protein ERCC-5